MCDHVTSCVGPSGDNGGSGSNNDNIHWLVFFSAVSAMSEPPRASATTTAHDGPPMPLPRPPAHNTESAARCGCHAVGRSACRRRRCVSVCPSVRLARLLLLVPVPCVCAVAFAGGCGGAAAFSRCGRRQLRQPQRRGKEDCAPTLVLTRAAAPSATCRLCATVVRSGGQRL